MTLCSVFADPGSSLNQGVSNTLSPENVCFCCLAQNEFMINLRNCTHKAFLQPYFLRGRLKTMLICTTCHTMLKKIMIFQNQVEESNRLLKKQLYGPKNKLYNLKQSKTAIFTMIYDTDELEKPKISIKNELAQEESEANNLKQEMEMANQQEDTGQILTNIKVEFDNSDSENNLPLTEVYKRNRKVIPRPNRQKLDEKYNGKIKLVHFTMEEMTAERERESKKESYLKLPFKCESCIKGFDNESTFLVHNERHQRDGGYRCEICNSVLSSDDSFKEHVKRHLRRFECVPCGKRALDVYSISHHYNREHSDLGSITMKFNCYMCDFTSTSMRTYRYHVDKHRKQPKCNLCDKTFSTPTSLKIHLNNVHNQSTHRYKCSECDKMYKSKSGLFNHTASAHGGGSAAGSAYCASCKTHFATKTNLGHHLRTHSAHVTDASKKFACADCDAKFLTKLALQSHIDWDHLKQIKYECKPCAKVFKAEKLLKKHDKYVHEKKRPPRDKICDHCGRAFFTTQILVSHIRTHTGERPLKCPFCDATFGHKAALYTHKKLKHKKQTL